jgi:hypothetical protein
MVLLKPSIPLAPPSDNHSLCCHFERAEAVNIDDKARDRLVYKTAEHNCLRLYFLWILRQLYMIVGMD